MLFLLGYIVGWCGGNVTLGRRVCWDLWWRISWDFLRNILDLLQYSEETTGQFPCYKTSESTPLLMAFVFAVPNLPVAKLNRHKTMSRVSAFRYHVTSLELFIIPVVSLALFVPRKTKTTLEFLLLNPLEITNGPQWRWMPVASFKPKEFTFSTDVTFYVFLSSSLRGKLLGFLKQERKKTSRKHENLNLCKSHLLSISQALGGEWGEARERERKIQSWCCL